MAFYDNKYWLLSHIRNSFLYTDDTGMCEMVICNSDLPAQLKAEARENWFSDLDDSEEESEDAGPVHRNFDNSDTDFAIHRRRVNTAVRLEKLKKEQMAAALTTTVRWKDPLKPVQETKADSTVFAKRAAYKPTIHKVSALTEQLNMTAHIPVCPYLEYAKFDGQSHSGVPVKNVQIYLTMLPKQDRSYPLSVCVLSSAKVSDLIGLTLYQYYMTQRKPVLDGPIDNYALYIAEDDGMADSDFPALEPAETMAKFGFTSLALVFRQSKPVEESAPPVAASTTTVATQEPAKPKISSSKSESLSLAMDAPLYQSFKVVLQLRVRPNVEVYLGVSWERVEIEPVPQRRTKFWPSAQPSPVLLPLDIIVACEMDPNTKSSRETQTFELIYAKPEPSKYRRYHFEADKTVAHAVVEKIHTLIELRNSIQRREYLHAREKKLARKRAALVRSNKARQSLPVSYK
nr:EOG090X072S [Triops cancriformis]